MYSFDQYSFAQRLHAKMKKAEAMQISHPPQYMKLRRCVQVQVYDECIWQIFFIKSACTTVQVI